MKQSAQGLREDARNHRKLAHNLRDKVPFSSHLNPESIKQWFAIADEHEQRAQELDRQADAIDGGKPESWWRSLPIPFGGEK